MRRFYLLLFLLAIVCASCARQYADFFPYHDDGTAKPVVALITGGDVSTHQLSWNVTEELTDEIRERMKISGHVYLIPEQELAPIVAAYRGKDLIKEDVSFFAQFKGCDYIILTELVEHEERPFQRGRDVPLYLNGVYIDWPDAAVLDMKLLVKVVDMRAPGEPRIHLQEVIESSFVIPAGRKAENYKEARWGTKQYDLTVMQNAHETLARKVKERLERVTYMAPG